MQEYGFDVSQTKVAICAVRHDTENDVIAAALAMGISTPAEKGSPGENASQVAAATLIHDAKENLDLLFTGGKWSDSRLVTAAIDRTLTGVDDKLQEYGKAIVQGVYAGGCIFVCGKGNYTVTPFGGACVYTWDSKHLSCLAGGTSDDGMIRSALGLGRRNYLFLQGRLTPGGRMIITTRPIADIPACEKIIQEEEPFAPSDATAILIRQEMEKDGLPAAVFDFNY